MQKMNRVVFRMLITVCMGFIPVVCLGQTTLTGYSNSASLPNYNADESYALFDEWMGLIDPNLDALPSARETEIYQELVRGERGTSLISSFDWNNKFADDGMYVWGSAEDSLEINLSPSNGFFKVDAEIQ